MARLYKHTPISDSHSFLWLKFQGIPEQRFGDSYYFCTLTISTALRQAQGPVKAKVVERVETPTL